MGREVQDLRNNAVLFWSPELTALEREASVIPKLLETQDKFISLLNLADADPFNWKRILACIPTFPANLFLKHLMVLADVGGEKSMRFKQTLPKIFEDGILTFIWREKRSTYTFQTLTAQKNWTNTYLFTDGVGLSTPQPLNPMLEDVVNLLLFGGLALTEGVPAEIMEKCIIGNLIGYETSELEQLLRQRYIGMSKITNDLPDSR